MLCGVSKISQALLLLTGSTSTKVYHTLVAVLEILGLGILMFILRIIASLLMLPLWFLGRLELMPTE
ncbi:hypothetical protein X556_1091 [Chlamydia pneumoniae B21]|nr:hypothetical protein X556_1091 [Chlamydia pneumoniae B21]